MRKKGKAPTTKTAAVEKPVSGVKKKETKTRLGARKVQHKEPERITVKRDLEATLWWSMVSYSQEICIDVLESVLSKIKHRLWKEQVATTRARAKAEADARQRAEEAAAKLQVAEAARAVVEAIQEPATVIAAVFSPPLPITAPPKKKQQPLLVGGK
jgi:hypothetical protein